ncbi:hypothetical protein T265_01881 [Opisthorchis viverrini]|uniref:Uncharacterized protein n=1 Tax=Opisthorchis viverrini TaxID=6198 RepID=A0A074ZXX6_OPIVI|nr:hypothetical protein T265_01881 [Opisthorchis viverrini]KER31946.1 hypothetical protein T265_01881 [Opisthorchis viverrini]
MLSMRSSKLRLRGGPTMDRLHERRIRIFEDEQQPTILSSNDTGIFGSTSFCLEKTLVVIRPTEAYKRQPGTKLGQGLTPMSTALKTKPPNVQLTECLPMKPS